MEFVEYLLVMNTIWKGLSFVDASKNGVLNGNSSKTIYVLTKHYEPFMYRSDKGQFYDGIEFKLIQTIAREVKHEIEFIEVSRRYDEKKRSR